MAVIYVAGTVDVSSRTDCSAPQLLKKFPKLEIALLLNLNCTILFCNVPVFPTEAKDVHPGNLASMSSIGILLIPVGRVVLKVTAVVRFGGVWAVTTITAHL